MNKRAIPLVVVALLAEALLAGWLYYPNTGGQGLHSHYIPLTHAQRAQEQKIERLNSEGTAALRAAQFAQAEKYAKESLAVGPNHGIALEAGEMLATALDAQGKTQEALDTYQKINDMESTNPGIQLSYARLLLKTGHWAKAVKIYNNARDYLYNRTLLKSNSHFTESVHRPKELATDIHIGLGLVFDYGEGLLISIQNVDMHSRDNAAMAEYKQALASDPHSALANYYYGLALKQDVNRIVAAQAAFKKAIAFGNDDIKAAAGRELKPTGTQQGA